MVQEMGLQELAFKRATVLQVKGNINSNNAPQFSVRMNSLIESGCPHLIVDLTSLSFMTSAGFRALLIAGRSATEAQCAFSLCGLNERVRQLFELGGFLDLFPIHANQQDALIEATK